MGGGTIGGSLLEGVLRRDRIAVVCSLLVVIVFSWGYLLIGAGMSMHQMDGMLMPVGAGPWTVEHAFVVLVMWSVMMAAMMLPSAAPMMLFYCTIARGRAAKGQSAAASSVFASGYLTVWAGFSLAAVALQFGLEMTALLSPMMQTTSVAVAATVLIAAGLYQWTPLKQACLRRCRSPLEFVLTHWRDGVRGAFIMGVQHGIYCVGCCWMLMLLLFVVGVMNLAWIAGLAAFILVEKFAPAGHWISRLAGALLVMWGAATWLAL